MTDQIPAPAGRTPDQRLHTVLAGVQALTGVGISRAQLIKFTNNAVFDLPEAGVVARIAASATMSDRVDKIIRIARWLQEGNVPAVRLLDCEQPLIVDDLKVTLWHRIPDGNRPLTGRDLGNILQRWHGLAPPTGGLPAWQPANEIRSRLAEPHGVSADDLAYLQSECDRIEEQLGTLQYELPSGPIHGDAFMGNLIAGPEQPVICDFDSSCDGPREWDLVPVAVGKLRFDYPGDDYGALAHQYGFDVIAWPGFPVLRRLRELKLVTSLVPVLASRPILQPQWQRRLDTYRNRDDTARWSTYVRAA
ncbi:phosphotransferase enzyme family protein [Actinoplanes sp. NPDC020271]|uniref:phosphotransferase enzyme family protein n=1 Tax=Actinoplanes sp. NPDC020271 TaxID=3363896 RepID=UPI0037A9A55A